MENGNATWGPPLLTAHLQNIGTAIANWKYVKEWPGDLRLVTEARVPEHRAKKFEKDRHYEGWSSCLGALRQTEVTKHTYRVAGSTAMASTDAEKVEAGGVGVFARHPQDILRVPDEDDLDRRLSATREYVRADVPWGRGRDALRACVYYGISGCEGPGRASDLERNEQNLRDIFAQCSKHA